MGFKRNFKSETKLSAHFSAQFAEGVWMKRGIYWFVQIIFPTQPLCFLFKMMIYYIHLWGVNI